METAVQSNGELLIAAYFCDSSSSIHGANAPAIRIRRPPYSAAIETVRP